jgi:tetratricopeptide (TPR) repeat protein
MRRDLLITALLFTAIGFAGGYLYWRQVAGGALRPTVAPAPTAGQTEGEALPEGHPPMDVSQRWRALQEAAEKNPRDPRPALELANFLYDVERWEAAISWYQRALELSPNNADARTDLATCYFNLKRFDDALVAYQQVLELERNKPQALYGLALARLHGKQDQEGARKVFEQLRRTHPDFPGVEALERALAQESSRP